MTRFPFLATAVTAVTAALLAATGAGAQPIDPRVEARIDRILKATPLIDGHNDLASAVRDYRDGKVEGLASGTDRDPKNPLMTDMARLHAGRVGGQFWSVYIDYHLSGDEAIRETLEQIDIARRIIAAYPKDLEQAFSAADIVRIHRSGKVASLLGVEGGDQMGHSFAALRQYYTLGARYMTLAHFRTTDWADSATDDPRHDGLTDYGKSVVREMNRLGMMVDLSHVSEATMNDAIDVSAAPVIFSHSGARAITDHPRNVPDSVLARLPANGGIVMVNFYAGYVSQAAWRWNAEESAEEALEKSLHPADPQAREAAIAAWKRAHPVPTITASDIADHVEHIVRIAGHDHVGIGGDLDGIPYDQGPVGMNSVAGYPLLFAELIRRGWSDSDLAKLAGGNLLRVMRRAEAVAASMKDVPPALDELKH